MNWIIRLLINAVVVLLAAYLLPGVGVDSFPSALIVTLVISILNILVRPILIIITIPITVITLGLFILVINGFIILLADQLIGGFYVNSFWWGLLLSFILSFSNSLMKSDKKYD